MPKVIVYVPAAAWRRLEERGLDPAATVREFAKRGYEMNGPEETPKSAAGATPDVVGTSRSASVPVVEDSHFKPDFKK